MQVGFLTTSVTNKKELSANVLKLTLFKSTQYYISRNKKSCSR